MNGRGGKEVIWPLIVATLLCWILYPRAHEMYEGTLTDARMINETGILIGLFGLALGYIMGKLV